MQKLVIFGNTVVAKLVHYYFTRDSEYEVVAFTVDSEYRSGDSFCGLPLVSFESVLDMYPCDETHMFIAVGPGHMNMVREVKLTEAKSKGYELASYISPNSVVHSDLGENSLVADGVVINPFSAIGRNNFFWEQCLICNDATIDDNCYFSPKSVISSYSHIENNSVVGTNSIIKARLKIAFKTLVGANCYISKDTLEKSVFGQRCSEFLGCVSEKIDISL